MSSKVQTLLSLKDFLDRTVPEDSPEYDKLLEQLDDIWYSMSPEEQDTTRKELDQRYRGELN